MDHEEVHSKRQGKNLDVIEEWWNRYLIDKQFRFNEELLAHKAEYQWFLSNMPKFSKQALKKISKRLSSPLYGKMANQKQAEKLLVTNG